MNEKYLTDKAVELQMFFINPKFNQKVLESKIKEIWDFAYTQGFSDAVKNQHKE